MGWWGATYISQSLSHTITHTPPLLLPSLQFITLVFPPFGLTKGIANIGTAGSCSPLLIAAGMPCDLPSPFDWDVAGRLMFCMVRQSVAPSF